MLRYKTNKQAFIIAALVILLCLVCLTGATLALFTSDPEDGTIGIVTTSGDVEVDIVDASDEQLSLVNGVLEFQSTSGNTDVLFEPGAIFRTQGFKIKNIGDIPINFRLSVSEDDVIEVGGDKITMEEFNKTFEIWISTDPNNPENSEPLAPFTGHLTTKEGERVSNTYYLYVKMKETAGNQFQGKIYTGIGVTVCAVQGNVNIATIKE